MSALKMCQNQLLFVWILKHPGYNVGFLEYILPSLQKAPAVLVPEFRTEERRLNIFKKTRMHPVHTEILLGYTSGDLFYWSLKDIKVVMPTHPFSLNPPLPH